MQVHGSKPKETDWDEKLAVESLDRKYISVPSAVPETLGEQAAHGAACSPDDSRKRAVQTGFFTMVWTARRAAHIKSHPCATISYINQVDEFIDCAGN